jgi:hypothetical protein
MSSLPKSWTPTSDQASRWFVYLLPVVAVVGLVSPLLLERPSLAILALYISVPLLVGPLVVHQGVQRAVADRFAGVETRRRLTAVYDRTAGDLLEGVSPTLAFLGVYTVLQAVSLHLLATNELRPVSYYVVVALLATTILGQILTLRLTPRRTYLALGQIALLTLNVCWGVTLRYHYYFGRTDVFPHAWWTELLVQEGHVTDAFATYQPFPLWHILAGLESMVVGAAVPSRVFLFVTSGIVYAFVVLSVFLVTRWVLENDTYALVAALLTSVNTWVVLYSMYSISRSVTAFLAVVLFLLLVRRGVESRVLAALLALGIVVYHTVSLPFTVVAFTVFYLVQRFVTGGDTGVRAVDIVGLAAIQLGYWLLNARSLVDKVVENLLRATGGGGSASATFPDPVAELANYLGFSFLLLFVVVGFLISLRDDRLPAKATAAVVTGTLLTVVSFPGPLLLVEKLASDLNVLRFGIYTFLFVGIAAAVGLVGLYETTLRDRTGTAGTAFRALVVVLFLSAAFFGVSNTFVASDNPVVERQLYTSHYSESETAGIQTISAQSGGAVLADQVTCKYLSNSPFAGTCNIIEVDERRERFLSNERYDLLILRTEELSNRGLKVFPTSSFVAQPSYLGSERYVEATAPVWSERATQNKLYASDDVAAYGLGVTNETET